MRIGAERAKRAMVKPAVTAEDAVVSVERYQLGHVGAGRRTGRAMAEGTARRRHVHLVQPRRSQRHNSPSGARVATRFDGSSASKAYGS